MARINLLPWREWERERKRKEFLGNLAGVLVGAVALVLVFGWYLDGQIESQQERNAFLEREITELDRKIAEIENLQKTRDELLARMRVIQELQGNRPVIVRIFDELVRTLAKGVHFRELTMQGNRLTVAGVAESNNRISSLMRNLAKGVHFRELTMQGNRLTVAGVAESNNRISSLMRNLDNSEWFANPNLKTIKEDPENPDYGAQASTFNLTFVQVSPNKPEDETQAPAPATRGGR